MGDPLQQCQLCIQLSQLNGQCCDCKGEACDPKRLEGDPYEPLKKLMAVALLAYPFIAYKIVPWYCVPRQERQGKQLKGCYGQKYSRAHYSMLGVYALLMMVLFNSGDLGDSDYFGFVWTLTYIVVPWIPYCHDNFCAS